MVDFKIRDYLYPFALLKKRCFLAKSERFSLEQLKRYQDERVAFIIKHAVEKVPYYRNLFRELGLTPEDVRDVESLKYIPPITKDIVRERFEEFVSEDFKKHRPYMNQTSGSTGTPLKFYQDKFVNMAKFAFFWRAWNWAGYRIGKRMAILEGSCFQDESQLYQYDWKINALRISSFKMTRENSRAILDKLLEFKPHMIRAYPSALYQFARYIESDTNPQMFSFLKSIVTGSETLHESYREYIQKVFGSKVNDCYHSWESICMISECEMGVKHHHMEYGVMELLNEKNERVATGVQGEITATGFNNLSMPFIRYKTRDLATVSNKKCECGKEHTVVEKIDGRIEDMIVTPEGNYAGRMDAAFKYNKGFDSAQIIQDLKDEIDVYLVKNSSFVERELALLEGHIRDRVGMTMEIKFHFVDHIEREKNGKLRFVISNYLQRR